MVVKEVQGKVKALLTQIITVFWQNRLTYRVEFEVEGFLRIKVDNNEVFLISISERPR